ncbi:Ig-like domain-containing protein, partial [Salinicola halophyticus]|uniref:Ig-like domain-containing protein n=1 Tax=Salinicola halophyticus TaxID=1808881 RepID=UPI003F46604A
PTIDPTNGDTITGTAEVGSTVTVTDDQGATIGEPVLVGDDGTWTVTPDAPLADGDAVTATATDPAGNASDPATETVDTLPPADGLNSVTIVSGDDELLSTDEAGNVTLTGQVEDGASIASLIVADSDGNSAIVTLDQITLNADGSFVTDAIDLSALADGELTATLTVEDAAGNTAPFTDTATLDTVAPDAPTFDPTDGDAITGTAEVGSTVTVTDADGNVVGEPVLVGDDGTWSVTPDAPLADGNEVTATATDPAGNVSGPATETVDTAPPAEGDNSVTIVSGDDELLSTDEAGNVTLTGQVEDGASIASLIVADSEGNSAIVTLDQITLNPDGSFVTDAIDLSALADGELTATLTVEDAAGNTAPFTDTATLDTVAPDAPTIDPTDGDAITGTAEVGSTVTVTDDQGATIGEPILVGDDGIWTVTPDTPLADGDAVTATATDPAGNVSGPATETVDVDALLPPTITLPETDDGFLNADELADGVQILADLPADAAVGDVINVTLAGSTGGIGGTYTLTQRDLNVGQALFEIEGDLADGDYTATSTLTRGDGSGSAPSDGYDFTVDTTPPGLPILALNPVSAVLSIDAEPDSVVRLAVGLAGQEVSLVVPTDENGDASVNLLADIGLDLDLSDIAQLGISVAAEDQAGNTSGFATIGLNPPDAAPPLPATDVAISDDGTTLSGVAEANATVLVDLDMDGTGDLTTTADDDGNFSFTVDPPLVDGELIDVIVVDAIGNASDPVAALAPRDEPAGGFAPRVFVQSVEGGYINADAADGGIDTRVRLPSDAAEGDTLTLQLTGGDGTTVAQDYLLTADDLAGRFLELTLDAVGGAFPQGAATIASIIDRGDSQTGSNSVAFDLDTIAPSTPVVDFLGTALSISGEPGSTVEVGISLAGVTTSVTFDVTDEEPVLLDLLGDISLDINPADLLNASVSVVGRDAAGNESSVAELNLGAGLLDGSDLVTIGGLGITDVSLGSLIPLSGPRLVIGGNTTPNSTLALTVGLLGGTATLDVMADENGDFGVNLLSADTISDLGLGVTGLVTELLSNPDLLSGISISATATNPEGNTSTEYGLSLSGSGVDLAIGAITIEGEDGGDRLTGTDQVEEIAAGDGDDIILNVGAGDTVEAGAGDDLIVTSGTDFDSIDGGDGFDTLLLDGGIDLDMVNGDVGAIGNVERLDLGQGDDASTVTLSAEDVDAMTDDDNVLQITGDQQDTLNIQGATSDGTVTLGGTAYDQYTFGDTAIQVEQDTVQVET